MILQVQQDFSYFLFLGLMQSAGMLYLLGWHFSAIVVWITINNNSRHYNILFLYMLQAQLLGYDPSHYLSGLQANYQ